MSMQQQNQGVSAHEFAGAIGGTLDTAQGNNTPNLPANSSFVVRPTGASRGRQFKGSNAGCLYFVLEIEVMESSSPNLPVGSKSKVFCGGLDSRLNNGSLAASAQADMRALLEAALGAAPGTPAPVIPPTPKNPNPGTGWVSVGNFLVDNPEYIPGSTKPFRIVTGAPKKTRDGGEFIPKQFFAIG